MWNKTSTIGNNSIDGSNTTDYFTDAKYIIISVTVISPILFFFGIIGNILSILIFNRKSMNKTTTSIYLRFLAVVDSFAIFFEFIIFPLRYYLAFFDVSYIQLKYFFCAFSYQGMLSFSQMSSWTIMVMTIDRSIFIFFPTTAKLISTRSRSTIICFILFFSFIGLYIHYYFTFNLVKFSYPEENKWFSSLFCTSDNNITAFYMYYITIPMDATLYSFVPSSMLIIVNTAIIIHLYYSGKQRDKLTVVDTKKYKKKSYQLTLTLVIISTYFIVVTTPGPLISVFLLDTGALSGGEMDLTATKDFLMANTICLTISFTNNAVNFYIYCITGSKFRRELFKLFHLSSDQPKNKNVNKKFNSISNISIISSKNNSSSIS